MKAVVVHENGGPDVLRVEEVDIAGPGPRSALVRIEAAGVNFIDVYERTGAYPVPTPFTPGREAAGIVEAVGSAVNGVEPGDRVAYASHRGAYAAAAMVPADLLVPIPDGVTTRQAAAAMLQGMTAHYLSHHTYRLGPGDTALVHAAAGGVGLLLVQMAHRLGARVIGTVSTEEKADLARAAGADDVIRYTETDFLEETRALTDGRGVDVVYDSVGKTTFDRSLQCLRPRGMMVLYGQSSGRVDPVDPQALNKGGSLFLTRPSLHHYTSDRASLLDHAGAVLGGIADGHLDVRVDRTFALAEAPDAHRYIEARKTKGKILLVP